MSVVSWPLGSIAVLLRSTIAQNNLIVGKSIQTLHVKSLIIPFSIFLSNHFIILYSKCGSLASARNAFDHIPVPNVFSFNSIISAYAKELQTHIAHQLFDRIPHPDIVSYNTLISAYADRGDALQALDLLHNLRKKDIHMDEFTLSSVITACAGDFSLIRQLHALSLSKGFDSFASVNNVLIRNYSRNGLLKETKKMFYRAGAVKDDVSWNTMIVAYLEQGKWSSALSVYHEMVENGIRVDVFTLSSLLATFRSLEDLQGAQQFHARLIKTGFHRNNHVGSALIDLYSKCGGRMTECTKLFEDIMFPDLVLWNTMISGFSRNDEFSESAARYFISMQRAGHRPDDCSFVCFITACSNLSSLTLGKQIHSLVIKSDIPLNMIFVENALVSMYSKLGNLQDARRLFRRMPERTSVSFNSMIGGYAQHGMGTEALILFEEMLEFNVIPTKITFVLILTACAHTGKVVDGWKYFDMMTERFGIIPDVKHYSCMINLLGRAGRLEDAVKLMRTMPLSPGFIGWTTFLGACRDHGNKEFAAIAAAEILKFKPLNASPYVMLADMYARAGKWDSVVSMRKLMREREVKKVPGCSWIEVGKRMHVFVADDATHPMINQIEEFLHEMIMRIKQVGYVPDLRWARMKDDEALEGEKETRLRRHSEKLAVAFGLMSAKDHEDILVVKNLRICGDCHNAIKFISVVTGREITIRDCYRFHFFKDGVCSCGDYW